MKNQLSFLAFILALLTCFLSEAQVYQKGIAVNPTDSFHLTASALLPDGGIITASQQQLKNLPGGSGLPGLSPIGKIVLRRLTPSGSPMWVNTFLGSAARITEVKMAGNGDVLVSGAYRDSLRFAPNKILYSAIYRANSFIACYDVQGNFKWVYSTPSDPNYSKIYYTFDVHDNLIYLPSYWGFNTATTIQVLNMQGDSVTNFVLADKALLISQFNFDSDGNLYFCGTGDPTAKVRGSIIGKDSTMFGYASYVVKLDSAFNHVWSDKFSYVTFDFYPEMAFNSSKVVFMVDTLPIPNGIGNHHILKYYDLNGKALRRDSIGPGFFSRMSRTMALCSFQDEFIVSTLSGWDTILVMHIDDQYNYTELARIDMNTAQLDPWLIANDSIVYFNHTFLDSSAIINKTDTVFNAKSPYSPNANYQQLMVKFAANHSNISVSELQVKEAGVSIFPNPSSGGELSISFHEETQETQRLKVYSIDGTLQYDEQISAGTTSQSFRFKHLASGVYIIHLESPENNFTARWIKL